MMVRRGDLYTDYLCTVNGTILHDLFTISCHETTARNESPRTPSVLSRHSQATASHPKPNIRLRVRNRHLNQQEKRRFQEENRPSWKIMGHPSVKSCVCSAATLSTEGLFKNPLRKLVFCDVVQHPKTWNFGAPDFLLRSPFGRPTPVWGPRAGIIPS